MTDTSLPKSYADSRTGRGDKWFQQINDLKKQIDDLKTYAETHKTFAKTLEGSWTVLPLNSAREIARNELMEFCTKRAEHAHKTIERAQRRIDDLENNGVPDE